MNCQTCGRPLPTGVGFCPSCGAATPYNTVGQNVSSPYAPTIASPYGAQSALASEQVNPYTYSPAAGNPYTAYGAAGMPAQDPYNNTPYAGRVPAQNACAAPAGAPPYSYNAPGTGGYPPGMQPGTYGTNVLPKRRSRVGLIIGIAVVGLVLLCGGLIAVIGATVGKSATAASGTPTSATTTTGAPTSNDVVVAASKIIFNAQTSSAIDSNDLPTKVTTAFPAGQYVYLTFQEDSLGKNGYIQVKWYKDGSLASTHILKHSGQNDHGYFSRVYGDTGDGVAALYWCTQSSCSDAQLAQVAKFTITTAAAAPVHNSGTVAVLEGNRRIG
jgi:hypothetical protein